MESLEKLLNISPEDRKHAEQVLLEVGLPVAGVTAVLWLLLSLIVGKQRAAAYAGLSLAVGLALGNYLKKTEGLPWLPEADIRTWIIPLGILGGLLGVAAAWPGVSRAVPWAVAMHQGFLTALLLGLPTLKAYLPNWLEQAAPEAMANLEPEFRPTFLLV